MLSIDEIVAMMISDMGNGVGSIMGFNLSDVLQTPGQYSSSTQALMNDISATVIMPVATTILVVLFCLELTRVATRTEIGGQTFLQVAFFTLVKFVMIKIIFENTPVVMAAIYDVFATMASGANRITMTSSTADPAQVDAFVEKVSDMDLAGQLLLLITLFFAWLVNKGAVIAALGLVVMRFVRLYIFAAFAPVPMAFFATQDTRQFGIGFLRNYGATVLQALVLVLAWAIYHALTASWANDLFGSVTGTGWTAGAQIGLGYMFLGVLLAMIMFGAGRIANELLGH